jgi:hypothetical protein
VRRWTLLLLLAGPALAQPSPTHGPMPRPPVRTPRPAAPAPSTVAPRPPGPAPSAPPRPPGPAPSAPANDAIPPGVEAVLQAYQAASEARDWAAVRDLRARAAALPEAELVAAARSPRWSPVLTALFGTAPLPAAAEAAIRRPSPEALRGRDPGRAREAALALAQRGTAADVAPLSDLAARSEAGLPAVYAAFALTGLRGRGVGDAAWVAPTRAALIRQIERSDPAVAAEAARVLAAVDATDEGAVLRALVAGGTPAVRSRALALLAEVGTPEDLDALDDLPPSPEVERVRAALQARVRERGDDAP